MPEKINPIRETDDEARELASKLARETRYGSLGVLETGTGTPLVSRVAVAWSEDTGLFFSASDLSVHSKCLLSDSTCSVLLGEPGKGDGLAYPRVTVIGRASRMANDSDRRARFREVFLSHHPKAKLYVDFADFGFYPLIAERAQLNGGFGKAFHLEEGDLQFLAS